MALPPIVALEIGTSKVCALVGEVREDGHLTITGLGEVKSIGVRKGEIVHFDNAMGCVRKALQEAEEQANIEIHQVYLVISGAQIRGDVNRGTVHVINEDREITEADVEAVADVARKINLPAERDVLHSIAQQYYVDGQEGVVNPEGMEGFQLALDTLILHAQGSLLRNTVRVARTIPVEVQDIAYAGLCASLSVLTPEQKAGGVALIDLGGGTTNVLAYADQCVAMAESLAIGGDHITNDIVAGLNLLYHQAEKLKKENGAALVDRSARTAMVTLAADGGFSGRTVRAADLQTIIHARMDETLDRIRAMLEKKGILHKLGAGLVLTGRGAHLTQVCDLAERIFNLPCVIGAPRQVSGLAAVINGPDYAAPIGMLRYAAKSGLSERRGGIKQWIQGVMGFWRA